MDGNINHKRPSYVEHLSGKVFKGGIWLFGLRTLSRGFDFIGMLILARFLLPADFGIIGVVGITISITYAFTGTGVEHALVQKKGDISDYLNTAWMISAVRGIIISAILYAMAPYVAILFKNPHVTPVLRVSVLTILFSGAMNIGFVYFQKDLKFNRIVYLDACTGIAKLTVSIPLAIYLQSAWAIVWGNLAGAFVKMIISYVIHPFRPRIRFDIQKAKELFSYGKWILGSGILWFLVLEGDDLFVGKWLGLSMLGFYQLAYKVSNIPATEITAVITKITFPAFARLQDEPERLKHAFLDVFQVVAIVLFPISGGIFVLSESFTYLFLGAKWMPMLPALKVLVFAGFLRALSAATGPVLLGLGKPAIDTQWQTVRLIVLIITIGPLTYWYGITGTAGSVLMCIIALTILVLRSVKDLLGIKTKEILKIILVSFLNVAVMVAVVINLSGAPDDMTKVRFTEVIVIGAIAYALMTFFSDRLFNSKSYSLLWRIILEGRKGSGSQK
jgi:O-antigen/teichoic acid export membrane protein